MNRDWYQQAVHSIRWSPAKRAEIEARLREDPASHPMPINDWEDELNDPEEVFRQQNLQMIRSEEIDMKHRRFRKVMLIGLLAATLATGGAIASAAAYAKKHPQTLNITWKNGVTLNLTNEESTEPYYMDYYANPNYGSFENIITPTENGFYFRKYIRNKEFDESQPWIGIRDGISTLMYADRESGQVVPVCARANCLHDGNEYCPATTSTYANSYLTYYDGYLYAVTTKYLHPEERMTTSFISDDVSPENCRQVLIRYAPDGTEITELAEFGTGVGATKCVINRGYVWCIVQLQEKGEDIENPITHNTSSFISGGWQLWGYELATGKSAILFDAMGDPTINHVNKAPDNILAAGDSIYFDRDSDDWSGAQGLCRLSLLTGDVTSGEEEVLVIGKHTVCMSATHAIRSNSRSIDGENMIDYYLLNLETREETPFLETEAEELLAEADNPNYGRNVNDTVYISNMNDEYIFGQSGLNHISTEGEEKYFYIYDYEGNLLKKIDTGVKAMSYRITEKTDDGYNSDRYYTENIKIVAVDHEYLYVNYCVVGSSDEVESNGKEITDDILYCSIESLLNDEKPQWKLAYSVKEEVRGNAQ